MATLNVKNFPDDLYATLKGRAAAEHRSVAGKVIHLLQEATREQEPLSILQLRGLGSQLWKGTDATEHVRRERDSWS